MFGRAQSYDCVFFVKSIQYCTFIAGVLISVVLIIRVPAIMKLNWYLCSGSEGRKRIKVLKYHFGWRSTAFLINVWVIYVSSVFEVSFLVPLLFEYCVCLVALQK